jgi:hypothetical protein
MKYEFRRADGRSCCKADNPEHLCDQCKAELARQLADQSRSLEAAIPPNPYVMDDVYLPEPSDDPSYSPYGTPPDGYAIALAALAAKEGR